MKHIYKDKHPDFYRSSEEHLGNGIAFTGFYTGQMKDEVTWNIWRQVRTHIYGQQFPDSKAERVFVDITTQEEADTFCRILNGAVRDTTRTVNAYENLMVGARDGSYHPAMDCEKTCLVY